MFVIPAALSGGCGRQDTKPAATPLTPAQEIAVKEYVTLLEEKIEFQERTAAVLATVQDNAASKTAALEKLLQLERDINAFNDRAAQKRPIDMAVLLAGQERVLARELKAVQGIQAEVSRIVRMPGGEDFFDKQLKPLLEATKGR